MTATLRTVVTRHGLPILLTALFVLPLVFLVTGSLRPIGLAPPAGVELLPPAPSVESYARLDDFLPVTTFLRNSLIVTLIATPLTVLVASLAGFGIQLLPRGTARRLVLFSLVVMLVPVTAVWATRFQLFRLVGLTDSWIPLIAPALMATNPFYVLIYVWAFRHIPQGTLDAARVDGAGHLTTWWRVAMPQVRAATLAVGVLAFTFHWSNFIDPLLYLSSMGTFTLPLGLRFLQQLNPTDWPLLMAACVVVTVPVVAVLLAAQRWLLSDRALKEIS